MGAPQPILESYKLLSDLVKGPDSGPSDRVEKQRSLVTSANSHLFLPLATVHVFLAHAHSLHLQALLDQAFQEGSHPKSDVGGRKKKVCSTM